MNMLNEVEEDVSPNIFSSLPAILWQRRWLLIPPIVLISAAGVAAAYLLPAQYQSSATILIESAQLKADPNFTNGPQVDVIQQRIARARERVLSRQDLIRAIRANNLYPREQQTVPLSEIVEKMRADTVIAGSGMDASGGMMRSTGADTIALRIAYTYEDPAKAQIVAQQFVNRFLELDAESAADQAKGAERFLRDQMSQLQSKLDATESQINRIKAQNGSILALGERSTGDPIADVARLDSDIALAQSQLNALLAGNPAGSGDQVVNQLKLQLADLRSRYSESHPDVLAAKGRLEAAQSSSPASTGNNSAIAALRVQINALRQAKGMILSSSASTKAAAARAPALAAQVDQLEKQADALRDQQQSLSGRLQQAEIASRMETEQKGERLTLADPPLVPDQPSWPNRPMVIAAAVAAGIGVGFVLVMLFEIILRPIRGVESLRSITGAPPLALVPDFGRRPHFLIRWLERRNRRRAPKPS